MPGFRYMAFICFTACPSVLKWASACLDAMRWSRSVAKISRGEGGMTNPTMVLAHEGPCVVYPPLVGWTHN